MRTGVRTMGGLLLAAVLSPAGAAGSISVAIGPARPEDWRDLAAQSQVVATVTVTAPRIRVIRPEKKVSRRVRLPDGREAIALPNMNAYMEGVLARVRVDEIYKSDGHATVGGELEVFFQWQAEPVLHEDERLLLFLQKPIPLDALGMEKYVTWSGLNGTTLEYPGDIDRKGEKFDVARAYGRAMPEIWGGAVSLLSYTKDEETIALAIREAKAVAAVPPPLVALTAPRRGYVRGTVTLEGEVSDDLTIGSAQVTADGQELATFTTSPFTADWDSTSVPDGPHILKATVVDRAGQRVESAPVKVTVDNQRPSLTLTALPSELVGDATAMIPVQVKATAMDAYDPATYVRLVSITADGPVMEGDVADAELGMCDRAFQLRARPNPPGQPARVYTITYEARDAAGNTRRATTTVTVSGVGAGVQ